MKEKHLLIKILFHNYCETKSPCKLLRKCIENSMENMHTDLRVKKAKHKENKVSIDSNSLCTSLYRLTLFTKDEIQREIIVNDFQNPFSFICPCFTNFSP